MDAISSREESEFPGFYWRGRPTFHKQLKITLPSAISMWEGPWVCCLKWNGHQDTLTQKKVAFPCRVLNAGSSFITKWSNVWIPCGDHRERRRCPPHLDSVLTSLDTSRGTWSSMLEKVMMPDSSWKLIGIPISLCHLDKEAWSSVWPRE